MSEPTVEQMDAFRAAWHKADAEGRKGERVRDGLAAVLADAVIVDRAQVDTARRAGVFSCWTPVTYDAHGDGTPVERECGDCAPCIFDAALIEEH